MKLLVVFAIVLNTVMLYSIHGELVIRLLLLIQFRSFYVASVYSNVSNNVQ